MYEYKIIIIYNNKYSNFLIAFVHKRLMKRPKAELSMLNKNPGQRPLFCFFVKMEEVYFLTMIVVKAKESSLRCGDISLGFSITRFESQPALKRC